MRRFKYHVSYYTSCAVYSTPIRTPVCNTWYRYLYVPYCTYSLQQQITYLHLVYTRWYVLWSEMTVAKPSKATPVTQNRSEPSRLPVLPTGCRQTCKASTTIIIPGIVRTSPGTWYVDEMALALRVHDRKMSVIS